MDIPVESRPWGELGVDVRKEGTGDERGHEGVDEGVDGRGEEEFVYV